MEKVALYTTCGVQTTSLGALNIFIIISVGLQPLYKSEEESQREGKRERERERKKTGVPRS